MDVAAQAGDKTAAAQAQPAAKAGQASTPTENPAPPTVAGQNGRNNITVTDVKAAVPTTDSLSDLELTISWEAISPRAGDQLQIRLTDGMTWHAGETVRGDFGYGWSYDFDLTDANGVVVGHCESSERNTEGFYRDVLLSCVLNENAEEYDYLSDGLLRVFVNAPFVDGEEGSVKRTSRIDVGDAEFVIEYESGSDPQLVAGISGRIDPEVQDGEYRVGLWSFLISGSSSYEILGLCDEDTGLFCEYLIGPSCSRDGSWDLESPDDEFNQGYYPDATYDQNDRGGSLIFAVESPGDWCSVGYYSKGGASQTSRLTVNGVVYEATAEVPSGSGSAVGGYYTPDPEPSDDPTAEPSVEPSAGPTTEPSAEPTEQPSAEPTSEPGDDPSGDPSVEPSDQPSTDPSAEPSTDPTGDPGVEPSEQPSTEPTSEPGDDPSGAPSTGPGAPSDDPSAGPSTAPTDASTGGTSDPGTDPSTAPTSNAGGGSAGQPSTGPSANGSGTSGNDGSPGSGSAATQPSAGSADPGAEVASTTGANSADSSKSLAKTGFAGTTVTMLAAGLFASGLLLHRSRKTVAD